LIVTCTARPGAQIIAVDTMALQRPSGVARVQARTAT